VSEKSVGKRHREAGERHSSSFLRRAEERQAGVSGGGAESAGKRGRRQAEEAVQRQQKDMFVLPAGGSTSQAGVTCLCRLRGEVRCR